MKEVTRIFKIKQVKTSVYHPQSNGSLHHRHENITLGINIRSDHVYFQFFLNPSRELHIESFSQI